MSAHNPRIAEWRDRKDSAYVGSRLGGRVIFRVLATNRFYKAAVRWCHRCHNSELHLP